MKKNIEYNKDNKIDTNKINNRRIEEFDIRSEIRLLYSQGQLDTI